ncbi:hypothetical protein D3C85_1911460 [compost metagenome]
MWQGLGVASLEAVGDTHADRHDQFQFLLYRAGRNIQLFGNFQVAGAMQAAEDENALLALA